MPDHVREGVADGRGIAMNALVIGRQVLDDPALFTGLVIAWVGKADAEGAQRRSHGAPPEVRDDRRVQAAAHIGTHRHVGAQTQRHGASQMLGQPIHGLLRSGRRRRMGRGVPITALGLAQGGLEAQAGAGADLPDLGERRHRRGRGPAREDLGQSGAIDPAIHAGGKQGLAFRGEHEVLAPAGDVQRQDAEAITHQPEAAAPPVP